jgi:hypothetical protein
MKIIQIVFSKSTSKFAPFSWAIMLIEKTTYSHVSIKLIDSETNLPIYYQASHMAVNCMSENMWLTQEEIIESFQFEIDDKLQIDFKTFAIEKLGLPYGVVSIFGLGIVQFFKLFGKKINNPFKEAGATYVCSQLIAALLENAKVISLNSVDLNNMTPEDLHAIVENLPKILESE